jgi:hypothetical protein
MKENKRWLAVLLGCVTALGMQAVFVALVGQVASPSALTDYAAQFLALVLAGYVAGHLVGQWHALYGALAAVAYILVTVTVNAVREVAVARQLGLGALAPIDFLQIALTDIVAMTGASCGGWLAARLD